MSAKVRQALMRDGDMTIPAVADLLKRSYTWVYLRVRQLPVSSRYTYRGVIYVRRDGVDALAVLSFRAPKIGRPRKVRGVRL